MQQVFFDLLLHLFLRNKILKSPVSYVVNWYTVLFTRLMELTNIFTAIGLFKTEVTTCKYKVQVLCFQYMLVSICEISPDLSRHIGLKLLVHL